MARVLSLTLRDKLALIYTSAGSTRNVAALVGISHQRIGRILHQGEPGWPNLSRKTLDDPGLHSAIDTALNIHDSVCREQARVDKLPFSEQTPVYYARMQYVAKKAVAHIDKKTGEIITRMVPILDANGKPQMIACERAEAVNLHYLSDSLRNRWMASMHRSNKFYMASIGSTVNLKRYLKRGNDAPDAVKRRARQKHVSGKARSIAQKNAVEHFKREIAEERFTGRVMTPYSAFNGGFAWREVKQAIDAHIQQRHAPAAGEPDTSIADRVLFQLDTRIQPEKTRHDQIVTQRRAEKRSAQRKARKDSK